LEDAQAEAQNHYAKDYTKHLRRAHQKAKRGAAGLAPVLSHCEYAGQAQGARRLAAQPFTVLHLAPLEPSLRAHDRRE